MSGPPEVNKLLSPMIDRKVDLVAPSYRVDRGRVLSRIEKARHSEQRQHRRRRLASWAAAAALVVAAGGWHFLRGSDSNGALDIVVAEGSATQVSAGSQSAIAEKSHTRIVATGELETAEDSKANIRAADGLEIELGGRTRVALDQLQAKSRRLRLLRGAIRCAVPHRSASSPFEVLTPDVTITDLGTVFTVDVEGQARTTRVTVEEGEVIVQHASGTTRVKGPGSWSSPTAPPPPPTTATLESPPIASGISSSAAATPSMHPLRGDVRRREATLEEEAQLLRQGLAAERQSHFSEATSALSLLLRKYPNSSLAPDARAALQRVEARAHP